VNPSSHASQQLDTELVVTSYLLQELVLRQKHANGILNGLGKSGAVESTDGGDLSEGRAFIGEVEDVLFPARGVLEDTDRAFADDVDPGARVALIKYHFSASIFLDVSHGLDSLERLFGEASKESASTDDFPRFFTHLIHQSQQGAYLGLIQVKAGDPVFSYYSVFHKWKKLADFAERG
jgi:hypothetical protein